jgi:hypothetical protein
MSLLGMLFLSADVFNRPRERELRCLIAAEVPLVFFLLFLVLFSRRCFALDKGHPPLFLLVCCRLLDRFDIPKVCAYKFGSDIFQNHRKRRFRGDFSVWQSRACRISQTSVCHGPISLNVQCLY